MPRKCYVDVCLAVFGLSALAEGPMDSRSCVRAYVRACVRLCVTRYLEIRASDFSETWHKVASWRDLKNVPSGFLKKILVCPPGGSLAQKPPFLAEKWPFESISSKPRIRF